MGTGAESGLNLSRLTFNNYSALNLGLTPSAADPANAINVTKNTGDGGVLNLGNIDLTVNTLERGFDTATYTLIKANTLNGATGNIMTATAPGTRADVTATVDPVAKKVKLAIVQNSRDLTWNGGMGFWDVNIHPYGEWVDTGTADSQNFYNLDTVHFTDIDGLQKSLTLSGAVHPVDIFVNNTVNLVDGVDVNAPTFAGDGYLTGIGTTLTKDGPGTLIIANTSASDFTGDVTINQGTVQIASGACLGANNTVHANIGTTLTTISTTPGASPWWIVADAGVSQTIVATSATVTTPKEFFAGWHAGSNGTLNADHTTVTLGDYVNIGRDGGKGTLILTNGCTLAVARELRAGIY